jgi:hypothetical protein
VLCTIPKWALPRNKLSPDIVLIKGWAIGDPIPESAVGGHGGGCRLP